MTGVLIKGGNFDAGAGTEGGRSWPSTGLGEEPRPDSFPAPPEGAWPCPYLDLRLLACVPRAAYFCCLGFPVVGPRLRQSQETQTQGLEKHRSREQCIDWACVTEDRAVSNIGATWRPPQAEHHLPECRDA